MNWFERAANSHVRSGYPPCASVGRLCVLLIYSNSQIPKCVLEKISGAEFRCGLNHSPEVLEPMQLPERNWIWNNSIPQAV
jgi:hypothetical protein